MRQKRGDAIAPVSIFHRPSLTTDVIPQAPPLPPHAIIGPNFSILRHFNGHFNGYFNGHFISHFSPGLMRIFQACIITLSLFAVSLVMLCLPLSAHAQPSQPTPHKNNKNYEVIYESSIIINCFFVTTLKFLYTILGCDGLATCR